VVRKTKTPQGVTKRLSLAVLVDQSVRWEGTGVQAKRILEPVPAAQLKSIQTILMGAVGASAERGDQVIVETLPFDATLHSPPPEAPAKPEGPGGLDLSWLPKPLQDPRILAGLVVGALLLLSGLVFFAMKLMRKKGKVRNTAKVLAPAEAGENTNVETSRELTGATPRPIAPAGPAPRIGSFHDGPRTVEEFLAEGADERERAQAAEIAKMKISSMATHKNEILAKHISEEALKNPVVTAQVVRNWLQEG
jgi:flagellar M-ring protein FliF